MEPQKKKRWRRLRSSWHPISKLPTAEERKVSNKNVNTMPSWEFERALAEFDRQNKTLQSINETIENTVTTLERQVNRAECYLKMQEKMKKQLFTEELKRLPQIFHNAAAVVYSNHAEREKLFRKQHEEIYELMTDIKELKLKNNSFIHKSKAYLESSKTYFKWWKRSSSTSDVFDEKTKRPGEKNRTQDHPKEIISDSPLHPVDPKYKSFKVKNHRQGFNRDRVKPLRRQKLAHLDGYLQKEFYSDMHKCSNFHCYDLGRGKVDLSIDDCGVRFDVPTVNNRNDFGIRFRRPSMAKRGNLHKKQSAVDAADPFFGISDDEINRAAADPFFGMSDDEINTAFYTEMEQSAKDGNQSEAFYEDMDKCEHLYDRIARARMAVVRTDNDNEATPFTRPSSFLERISTSKNYAQAALQEVMGNLNLEQMERGLLPHLNSEANDNDNETQATQPPKPLETPAELHADLARFIRLNHPEILHSFSLASIPEAVKEEAKRLIQTPRDQKPSALASADSATKLMLDSYNSLDETGQNQMWLAACQSANKELIKGIVDLRKAQNNDNGKLAKLVKELLTHAEKAKIDPLKWHTQAQQRRTNFHNWISRIKDICAMFKETSGIMPKETIVPFKDKSCIGNKALHQLILSKIDNHCRDLLRHCNEEGDTALELLFVKCANITGVDTDHYHQLFVGLRAFHDESATKFIGRFLVARTSAERARNEYTDSKLVSYLLTGLSGHKNTDYQLLISIFREKIMSGDDVSFAELERRFLCIDETTARDVYSS